MHIHATPTRLVMRYHVTVNKQERPDLGQVYEGEIPMADRQGLKALLGDEKAKITVSREISQSDYGSGGKVFVSVTLTCGQDETFTEAAGAWANHLADKYSTEYFEVMKQKLAELGIVQ